MELIATLNYVGTHSYILPILDLPAYAIHGGAQGSIYFNYIYIYICHGQLQRKHVMYRNVSNISSTALGHWWAAADSLTFVSINFERLMCLQEESWPPIDYSKYTKSHMICRSIG